ncbi:MAG: polysaccharide biosynthesis C-terminal domain-containing protein [Ignavibacteriales bacterium]|nr:polysaccharide biosynthesis C-terminal domain-containing protein [Ignavibacteriales bacterium]
MGILGRNFLHTAVSNFVLKFVVGMVIAVVLGNALEIAERGEYFLLVLIITTITTVLNFGIPGTNTYFRAQKKFSRAQLTRASIILTIPISVLSFGLLFLVYILRLNFLFPIDKMTPAVIASLCIIPVVFFSQFAQGIIVGENRISLNNYISLSSQGALAITLTILYALHALTVTIAIGLFAASFLLAFGIIIYTSFPPLGEVLRARLHWHEYRELVGFSATIHVGNLTQFFNYRLDAFIVSYFLGLGGVGIYSYSKTFAESVWLLSASMAAVLLPTLAGHHAHSKMIAVKAVVATFAVSLAAGIAAFLIGPPVIRILLPRFVGSINPFLFLLPGVVIFSLTNVLATYLTAAGKPGYNAAIAFISFLFTVIFDILLIPRYGMSGAAFASGISYTMSSIMTVGVFWRVSNMTTSEFLEILKSMSMDFRSIAARLRQRIGRGNN